MAIACAVSPLVCADSLGMTSNVSFVGHVGSFSLNGGNRQLSSLFREKKIKATTTGPRHVGLCIAFVTASCPSPNLCWNFSTLKTHPSRWWVCSSEEITLPPYLPAQRPAPGGSLTPGPQGALVNPEGLYTFMTGPRSLLGQTDFRAFYYRRGSETYGPT